MPAKPRKAASPDRPESPFRAGTIYTCEAEEHSLVVNLGFPINMRSDQPNGARLTITDGTSRQVIGELQLSAEQLVDLLRGGDVHLVADYYIKHPERIGKRVQNVSTAIVELPGGAPIDTLAETVEHEYLEQGWEVVSIQRTNTGRTVTARRWVQA